MKLVAALAFTLSSLIAATTAQAQERALFIYSGSSDNASTLSLRTLSADAPPPVASGKDAMPARKVRVVLQSPYGN